MTRSGTEGSGPADDGTLGEFGRIARYFRPLSGDFPGALGLVDDAALLDIPADRELVVTMDALVEGVHFLPDDPPADLAVKALGVNVSDLAAMAADPYCYTLAVALPRRCGDAWLSAFADGLADAQRSFGIVLAGGDSVSTPGPLSLTVTATGTVPRGRALRRGGGRVGDHVYVSGTLGDAAIGLLVLRGGLRLDEASAAFLAGRYRRPRARTALAPALRRHASAGLDVSDGLVADLGHLCEVSGLAAVIEAALLPLSDAARAALATDARLSHLPLTGGDDYELVVSVPPDASAGFAADAAAAGVAVSRIGTLTSGPAGSVTVLDPAGRPLDLSGRGWDHFGDG